MRFEPEVGVFAALADNAPETLAAMGEMVRLLGDIAFLGEAPPTMPGVIPVSVDLCVQMIEAAPTPGPIPEFVELGDADAVEMLALATLTKPGPFFSRTHEMGGFIGMRIDGRLAAMVGERMQPEGHTEVSAVCVHPDFRGRGLAAGLTRVVGERIRARGETPFLHAYASNTPAITLYERLGYTVRREVLATRLSAA